MDEVKIQEIKVAKPEDWPAATEVKTTFTLDTLSGPLAFNLRAMSACELRELEAQLPVPEAPLVKGASRGGEEQRDFNDPDFLERLANTHFARWVMWIDKCWKPLPGATQTEKVKWAEENLWRNGEVTALWNQLRTLSGLGTGTAGTSSVVAPVKEADPETWAAASQAVKVPYKIPHELEVLVFELAGLSQLTVNHIRDMVRPPPPPMKFQTHVATQRPIPGTEFPDRTDPVYQQAVQDAELFENCLLLEAALFQLPGATKEAKRQWLDQRPCFEVIALWNHLNRNVLEYRSRVQNF
jgi:hypothetical protein